MKRFRIGCLAFLLSLQLVASASAEEVTSADLIETASLFDGETVVYTGEVIGDILPRGEHAWVNVSDGENAIGIWIDADMLGMIATVGRYGQAGDTLRITGVFHRACQEHGGEMDIHAKLVVVVKKGYATERPVSGWKIAAASVFAVLDAVILIVYLKKRGARGNRP